METDQWLVGWREIGKYLGKSARTAQRYAHDGMPFFRDPSGRPIVKPSLIDEYILDLNQSHYDDKTWRDEGIDTALNYEKYKDSEKEKDRKEFEERVIHAQRPVRSRF
jgi:hypothetical protein